jgi:hypothetical protein
MASANSMPVDFDKLGQSNLIFRTGLDKSFQKALDFLMRKADFSGGCLLWVLRLSI